MSLGGLAFSVGMVVDASIVVVENVRRHLAARRDPRTKRRVVAGAVAEVARPVAFSVLIIAIILVPLFTLQGVEGKMFAPLALTMLIALLVSLGVALTVVPVLADIAAPAGPGARRRGFVRRFHQGYLRLLERAIRRPAVTLGAAAAAAGARGRPVAAHRHRVHAPARRGLHRDQRRAPAERLARGLGEGRRVHGEAAARVPRGRRRWSARPAGRRSPRTRWARSRPTCSSCSSRARSGARAASKAELVEAIQKDLGRDPRPALLLLAAHRAAGQRAHLGREERPGGQGLRARPRRPQGLRRPRRRRDARRAGRPGRQGRAGLRHEPARRRDRPRGRRAPRHQHRRRQRRHRDGRRRPAGHHAHRGGAALRGGRAVPRGGAPRRPRDRAAAGPRAGRRARPAGADRRVPAGRGAGPGQPRERHAPRGGRGQRARPGPRRLRPGGAGGGRPARPRAAAGLLRRVRRPVREPAAGHAAARDRRAHRAAAHHAAPALPGARLASRTRSSCCSTCRSRWSAA